MQRLRRELKYLLCALADIRNVLGDGLPCRTVPGFGGDGLLDHLLLVLLRIQIHLSATDRQFSGSKPEHEPSFRAGART